MSDHDHNHAHKRDSKSVRRLRIALVITGVYMFAEAIGGWLANSLALLADAGHMLTDVTALGLTLTAFWISSRPANSRKTYGYHRLEILAAFVNGISLVLISLWIFYEAYQRILNPPDVKGAEMMVVAVGGLIVNLICVALLHADHKHDLNMRGAFLHVLGDLLGSVTAIIASVCILAFNWNGADAVCSILIGIIIIFGSFNLIRESVDVLLEGTPAHVSIRAVEESILQITNVLAVHDLHVWTITSGNHALSCHTVFDVEKANQAELLKEIRQKIQYEFGILHLTIQMETPEFEQADEVICVEKLSPKRKVKSKAA
jgi:cobalt-zinc-cadmium efflux system protein